MTHDRVHHPPVSAEAVQTPEQAEAASWLAWQQAWGNTPSGAHATGFEAGRAFGLAERDVIRRERDEAQAALDAERQRNAPLREAIKDAQDRADGYQSAALAAAKVAARSECRARHYLRRADRCSMTLAEILASNERLRAALVVPFDYDPRRNLTWFQCSVCDQTATTKYDVDHAPDCLLASSPAAPKEPAPDGYVPTAEAVEFPDAASAIAWLQADEDEPAPDEGARGGESGSES